MKPFSILRRIVALVFLLVTNVCSSAQTEARHIVLIAGDEEYRSEESMPMLAEILRERHGFKCTVLYSRNPSDNSIDPLCTTNLPGLEALNSADLCVLAIRFRSLPDSQMRHFAEFLRAGKPLIAIRTSTHAFAYDKNSPSQFKKFDWRSDEWLGGFGRQILGETWVNHHGAHGKESTRGIINAAQKNHPVLNSVRDVWGPTDVYTVSHLGPEATVLMHGQVLTGMAPDSKPVEGAKNDPMMPLVWLREYQYESGKRGKALTTTIGAAVDFKSEDLRRLLVNGCYYLLGKTVPDKADVNTVGDYDPSYFGFGKVRKK